MKTQKVINIARNVLLATLFAVGAQSIASEQPDATLSVDAKSVAVGVGVTWGNGVLKYQGEEYPVEVNGMSLVDVGAASLSIDGDVYEMKSLEDFEGNYVAATAGVALAGGAEGTAMKNQNGVVIKITSTLEGIKVKFAPEGIKVKLAE